MLTVYWLVKNKPDEWLVVGGPPTTLDVGGTNASILFVFVDLPAGRNSAGTTELLTPS